MRLLEKLPNFPPSEGRLHTHNTGGEHALKYYGVEREYNPLRRAELQTIDGQEVADIPEGEMYEMLLEDEHEVVFVHRFDLPEETEGRTGLIGAAIGQRQVNGRFDKSMVVRELVVHPELRGRSLASFMLGKLTDHEHFGSGQLTEMVFDNSTYEAPDWFIRKLIETGFRHRDNSGSPAIWLPGNTLYFRGDTDRDDPEEVQRLKAPMPDGWNGYIDLYPETNPQTQVFRLGNLLGIVYPDHITRRFDNSYMVVEDFYLYDAGGARLGKQVGVSQQEAVTALLNNYELIT